MLSDSTAQPPEPSFFPFPESAPQWFCRPALHGHDTGPSADETSKSPQSAQHERWHCL